jgi:hypothetical protein
MTRLKATLAQEANEPKPAEQSALRRSLLCNLE